MRTASLNRKTRETDIAAALDLDGRGQAEIETSLGFFQHMLETFARHGAFDLRMKIDGDLRVDAHHTVEDTGIVLGLAFKEALGEKTGIARAGWASVPMDETLASAAVDLSGRPFLRWEPRLKGRRLGDLDSGLFEDFFAAFSANLGAAFHLRAEYGRSDHHKIEALFKAFARALRQACAEDGRTAGIPSSVKEPS
ncbi:MAG: imidazoleglycerol-phosphate dehydratase HisB [Candidatus Aminicenantes bacterium]|nr:imidazoleglycerol-phosphate dehydratase HisB [Candidatus Aminicenantes bacterium]